MNSTMPFPADAPTPADPVAVAAANLRKQFESDKQSHYESVIREAEEAYKDREERKKQKFIKEYISDNYVPLDNPYDRLTNEDLFRLSLGYDERIPALLAAGCYEQALRCYVFRNEGEVSVQAVKEFLRPYLPVEGSEFVKSRPAPGEMKYRIHAEGLSPELHALLRSSGFEVWLGEIRWVVGIEDIERSPHLPTLPFGTLVPQRDVLAPERLAKEEW